MGYYNFYRLIREIRYLFSNKKIKKILTIIAIFIIIVLILHNKGYCTEIDINNFNYSTSVDLLDFYNNVVFDGSQQKFVLSNDLTRWKYCFTMRPGFEYELINDNDVQYSIIFSSELPGVDVPGVLTATINLHNHYIGISNNADGVICTIYTNSSSTFHLKERSFYYPYSGEIDNHYVTVYDLSVVGNGIINSFHEDIQTLTDLINSYLYGDETKTDYPVSTNFLNDANISSAGQIIRRTNSLIYYVKVKNGYNYTVNYKYNYGNNYNDVKSFKICYSSSVPVIGLSDVNLLYTESQTSNDGSYNYTATSDGYLCINGYNLKDKVFNIDIVSNYNESQELGLSQSIINNNNQNTQTIDNTITNSNVDVDENQLVTDNTQDITDSGYDNIFITIKNAFTGSPSAITFPLTFLGNGQNLVLQPDFLSSALNTAGLGVIVNVVGAYWYFVVCRYIVKKIHEIIEGLKEGELEKTTGNIKTEVF